MNISKIIVSNKVPFGKKAFKCFIGYKDTKKKTFMYISTKTECAYRKDFD